MLKTKGLGQVAAAANGITISGGTNATPIVATLGAGHGQKNGDRIAITGVTGLTAMNGEFTLAAVAATTAQLLGSVGNGVFGGAAVVSAMCDTTPFMKGHSAVAAVGDQPGAAVLVATVLVESSADNVTFADASPSGQIAIPAFTAGGQFMAEVVMGKYMRLRASAWTSGTGSAWLQA